MAYIYRGEGFTRRERYLAKLCESSFLKLWTYPNLYVDKGKKVTSDDGDELCDVLVVCGNVIIIFSDKNVIFSENKSLDLAWARWCRRSVFEALKQINGAERVIRERPEKIFLDSKCTQRFPLEIDNKKVEIFRVIVATGSQEACKRELKCKFGDLMVHGKLKGKDHITPDSPSFVRFSIGDINPNKGFVHVLDEFSLDLLLGEFDTLTDFTRYLRKRELLIRSNNFGSCHGEHDLVAIYLANVDDKGEHDFLLGGKPINEIRYSDFIMFGPGYYDSLVENSQYIDKKRADKISYAWDNLIYKFAEHIITGTAVADSSLSVADLEQAIRSMALESRLYRRSLASALLEAIQKAPVNQRFVRIILPGDRSPNAMPYIFMVYSVQRDIEQDIEVVREVRKTMLHAYCLTTLYDNRFKLKEIVGIAVDHKDNEHVKFSEDAMYVRIDEWNEDLINKVLEMREVYNIPRSEDRTWSHLSDHEYVYQHYSPGQEKMDKLKLRRKAEKHKRYLKKSGRNR